MAKTAPVQKRMKMHVRKGDTVMVIAGDDAGKEGKVLTVLPMKQQVIIDGVNIVKKQTRPTRTNPQGGTVERPGPINVSNVMLVCPNCNKNTRLEKDTAKDDKVRVCKKCGKAVD